MEPNHDTRDTLVDLLDRILDKGLVLDTDVIITVSGIPLVGINLRAAIASVDTMLRYGLWEDWDEAQRAIATEEQRKKVVEPSLFEGEEIILKMFCSRWYSDGIYRCWKPGHLYVTNRRVFLHRKEPLEILFMAYYKDIEGIAIEKGKRYLYLFLKGEEVTRLRSTEAYTAKEAIEARMKELGLSLERREVPV